MTEAPSQPGKLAVLGLLLLAWLAYLPAAGNGYALDDSLARRANAGVSNVPIAELHAPAFYFTTDYWHGIGARSGLYRPVTVWSYALVQATVPVAKRNGVDVQPDAPDVDAASRQHVLNRLLFVVAVHLVLALMLDFGLPAAGALMVAGLFAVHAIHSEVVATIIGRAELFAFVFGAWGLLMLRKLSWRWIPLASVSFFLAFGAKESALAWVPFAPCYLLARDWCAAPGGPRWRGLEGALLPMLAALLPAVIGFFVLRGIAIDGPVDPVRYAANPLAHVDSSVRVATAVRTWGYGLVLCAAPFRLACLYGPDAPPLAAGFAQPGVLLAGAVLGGCLAVALRRPRRHPGLFLAAAWFFGFGLITSNVLFPIGTMFGERLYFIPSLGVCMLPALWWMRLPPRRRRILFVACVVFGVANVAVVVARCRVFKDDETLFTHAAEAHPDCALVQMTAAKLFHVLEYEHRDRKREYRDRAWRCLRRARSIDPGYVETWALEAVLLEREGEVDAAIDALRTALAQPRLGPSGLEADLRKNLGRLLIRGKNRLTAGLRECLRSLRLEPSDTALRLHVLDIGRATLSAAQREELLTAGLAADPDDPDLNALQADRIARAPRHTRESLEQMGVHLRRALAVVREARALEPRFLLARTQLAECLAALGRKAEAAEQYRWLLGTAGVPTDVVERARSGLQRLGR